MVIIDTTVFEDFELLIERDSEWTRDVGAVKPQLLKECGLFRDILSGLQIKVPTDSLKLVTFRHVFII